MKIRIRDESGDREFFTIVPNYILNHSTSTDQALYLQMKRYAGKDGKCFATQETLVNKLGIGLKTYRKSLNYLIKRGWVEFIGLTDGKTRPIKTYKINNIWQENSDYYKKIVSESTLSKDTVQKEGDSVQKHSKIVSESTVEEDPVLRRSQEEDPSSEQSSQLIPDLIKLFEIINPSCKTYYGNTTQRKACKFLISTYGFEKVGKIVTELLPQTNGMEYLPTITTPVQLKDKWSQLEAAVKKERSKIKSKGNVYW